MRLLHLEVWNWRGLDHAVLPDLAPDLNLVVGPNESGKSRLFEALRYGLFERHKGDSEDKRRLKTWGSSESPAVKIEFEAGGRAWSLTKRFLKGASAKLTGPGTSLSDDDAEEKVRSLWGTQEIKGRTEPERFLGLWPLLWVQQGRAGLAPHDDMNADTRTRLSEALAREVHEVAAGRVGQRIVLRAEAERARYWTLGWKEREELSAKRTRQASAKATLERKVARRQEAHGAADELERTLERARDLERSLAAQRERVARADAKLALADERAQALATRELEARSLHADRELLAQRARERAQLGADVAAMTTELSASEQDLAHREQASGRHEVERASARARCDAAQEALAQARERAASADAIERRTARATEVAAARKRLAEAERHRERARAIEEELHGLPSAAQIKALRQARETWTRAHASLDAAAARVTLRALVPLVVDGRPLEPGRDLHFKLDEPTAISLEGIAELHVSPAGAELDRLRDTERDAREVLDARLSDLGVDGIGPAEEGHRRRIELEAERKHAEASLAALGGADLDRALRSVLLLETEQETLAASPEGVVSPPEEARRTLTLADEELHASRVARDVVEREALRLSADVQVKKTLLADLRARLAAAAARLSGLGPTETITAALEEADRAWTKAEELARSLREELRRSGDLDAGTDRERERAALSQIEASHRELLDRRIALETSQRHFGAEAIHEEVQDAEAELAEASRELAEVERRAEAVRALVLALTASRHEIQVRLVAPVQKKVEPYLESLLPGARLDVGEDWAVEGLVADGRTESFEALSGGAKEQVGLLVRLGLAEVLGEAEPLPVVLDDCLVNTDAARQTEMIRILYRASRRQQILLFSCHDVAFERLGATRRYELAARRAR